MSKLVDKERLAKLAKALNDRMKAAVAAEKTERLAAESRIEGKADQNAAAIAAINNEENGLLAQAQLKVDALKDELNPKIAAKVDESTYNAKVTELENKDKDMAADILGLDTAVKAIENKMGDGDLNLPAIDKAIKDFQEAQLKIDEKQNQDIVKAQEAADKAQEEVDAVEKRLDEEGGLVDRLEGVEDFVAAQPAKDEAMQGEIDALEDRAEALEQFVEDHSHEEIEGRLDDLEALFEGEGSVDSKIEAVHNEVVALESKHDLAAQAQATKDQAQDEAIAAKVAIADYEDKMEALDAEDERIAGLVATEEQRADAAEKALGQRIDAIVNAETGLLKQAKDYADQEVKKEADARAEAEEVINGKIKDIEDAAGLLEGRVAANEAKLAGLEKDTVQAAIDQAEADAKAHAEQKIADLVDSAPEAMNTLNELAKAIKDNEDVYKGYVEEHAQAMAQQKADLQKEIDDDIAAAKVLISAEIDADVKAEADRAKEEEQAIRTAFAAADAKVLEDAAADAAAKVAVEKGRAEGQEAAIRQELANEKAALQGEITAVVLAEENRAKGEEGRIEAAYKLADQGLSDRIADLEDMMGVGGEEAGKTALEEIRGDITAIEEEVQDLKDADVILQGNIDKKVDQTAYDTKVQALEGADTALDNRIKVFEVGGDQDVAAKEVRLAAAEQDIKDLQAFEAGHDHTAMENQIALNKQGVADNAAAIAKEVEDRDAAIEEALKAYATEAETLAVIGNVVNSLALTMENNKMVLKLGGANGIAINEVSLDMVTDSDIEEIIAGLDAE